MEIKKNAIITEEELNAIIKDMTLKAQAAESSVSMGVLMTQVILYS